MSSIPKIHAFWIAFVSCCSIASGGETMTVSGVIKNAKGGTVKDGKVALVFEYPARFQKPPFVISGIADQKGQFELTAPAYTPSLPYRKAVIFVSSKKHGFASDFLDYSSKWQELEFTMPTRRDVRGRLTDLRGQPAFHVAVNIVDESLFSSGAEHVPFWPRAIRTDDRGRFLIRGMAQPTNFASTFNSPFAVVFSSNKFAPQSLPPASLEGPEVRFALVDAKKVRGIVKFVDTGQPVAKAKVSIMGRTDRGADPGASGPWGELVEGVTDENGRFELNSSPGDTYFLTVEAPQGTPYFRYAEHVRASVGDRREVSIRLNRANLVAGTLRDDSGQPIANASIEYRPKQIDNPHLNDSIAGFDGEITDVVSKTRTDKRGRFQIPVLFGKGHIIAMGPSLDFVPVETSFGELEFGKPGGLRFMPDAIQEIDISKDERTKPIELTLQRGITLRGRAVGTDRKPVKKFLVYSRTFRDDKWVAWQDQTIIEGRDGSFEVPGCKPNESFQIWCIDVDKPQGVTATVVAKPGDSSPVTVHFQPTGKAEISFVNHKTSEPVSPRGVMAHLLMSPGARLAAPLPPRPGRKLEAQWAHIQNVPLSPAYAHLRDDVRKRPLIARNGVIKLERLIPGATYGITPIAPHPKGYEAQSISGNVTAEFVAKSGATIRVKNFEIGVR